MDPIIYSLCHKPVLGLAMFVAGACAFPPLFHDAPFALQQAGASAVREFEAPVGKAYSINLNFRFASGAASYKDDIVGSRHDESCGRAYESISLAQRMGLGRPIPVHVLIREQQTGTVTLDKVFTTLCLNSSGNGNFTKTREVARVPLAAGKYVFEIRNIESQAGLDDVKTTVSLVSGDRK